MNKKMKLIACLLLLCVAASVFAGAPTETYAANVQQGSRGTETRYVQYNLNMLGFSVGTVDSIAGNKTVQAIKNYQRSRGLAVDGIAGPATQNSLYSEIKEIQSLLNKKGFSVGTVDGVAGPNTINALKSFQSSAGLSATGVCDAATLSALKAPAHSEVESNAVTDAPVIVEDIVIFEEVPETEVVIEDNNTCKKHKYTSASGDICTVCGYVFVPTLKKVGKTMYIVKDNVPVRTNYYSQDENILYRKNKDSSAKIAYSLKNSLGNIWYKTEDGYYIYSENLTSKEPPKYTLTFYANGSGVTNLPGKATVFRNVRYGLSRTVVPARAGYAFVGYSENKNSTTPEYLPGAIITMTENKSLYAIWKKISTSSVPKISKETKKILDATEGFPQVKQINKDGSRGPGLCTTSATALMLKRKQIVDGLAGTFNFYDVRMSFGLSRANAEALRGAAAFWTRAGGFSNLHSGNGNITYYTSGILLSNIGSTVEQRKAKIIELLNKHPEGIVIYCSTPGSKHAILLTEYDSLTNTFYACDSVDVRDAKNTQGKCPTKLTETYLYRELGRNVDNIFRNLIDSGSAGCVWYISNTSYN